LKIINKSDYLEPMLRLSRYKTTAIKTVLLLFLILPLVGFAAEGYASLKIAAGAREAAMGEVGVAGAKTADAIRWNPALLNQGSALDISLHHTRWLLGTSQSAFFLKRNFGKVALGAEALYFSSGDLELRDSIASSKPIGKYSFADLSLGMGVAFEVSEGVKVGLIARFYNERLWKHSGSTWGFDAGFAYNPFPELRLGVSVIDLGFNTRLAAASFRPPVTLRLGTAYSKDWSDEISTALNIDFMYRPYSKEPGLRTGLELKLFNLLALRAGAKFLHAEGKKKQDWKMLSPTQMLTFGIGIAHKGVALDYALVPYNQMDLGLTHRISLNLSFD